MHITKSADQITPFGGLNFVVESFHQSGLAKLIDRALGPRVQSRGYSYSDIFANQLAIFMAGGDCAEDLAEHLRGPAAHIPGLELCSPDTLLRGIKELAQPTCERVHPDSGVRHPFNINAPLNDLLIRALRTTGQLQPGRGYDLDYDNQIIAAEKWDATRTYKQCEGYQPGVGSIEGLPVYIEGRGGHSQATFEQSETLRRMFARLEAHRVHIGRFRADVASYQQQVVEVVAAHSDRFYIRARRSAAMEQQIGRLEEADWRPVRLGIQQMQVAAMPWQPFGESTTYRLIVSRLPRSDRQTGVFGGQAYTWRAILTDDWQTAPEQIVAFYNQRGAAERVFDQMNNDFGWSRLPCSLLAQNTAFMIITALIANFYHWLMGRYAQEFKGLKATDRLKKFIFRFVTVPAKWIRSGRQSILKLYTDKDYSCLLE